MKIKPLSNRALIKETPKKEKTESGIILPDTTEKEGTSEGEIIAIGEGQKDVNGKPVPMSVSVGDKVLFKKGYSVDEIKIGKEEYLVMKEKDIIGII